MRGLGDEVASIAIVVPDKKGKGADKDKGKGADKDKDKGKGTNKDSTLRAWVACGRKVCNARPAAHALETRWYR